MRHFPYVSTYLIPGSEDDGDKMQTLARFFAALMILIFIYVCNTTCT